jgi:hypothetical protein
LSKPNVLIVGDTHHPWAHEPTLQRIYAAAAELKPGVIVQIGDLRDMYGWSRYPTNPNVMSPADELDRGTERAAAMWKRLQRASPKARCIQLLGNHDIRPNKRLSETLPECKLLAQPTLEALFEFPDVETIHDDTEEVFIETAAGEVALQHGHRSKLGDHARHNQMSTVVGHSHTGGCVFLRQKRRVFWELNAGWVGEETAPVFRYGNQKLLKSWTRGVGYIDRHGPRFVSMQ